MQLQSRGETHGSVNQAGTLPAHFLLAGGHTGWAASAAASGYSSLSLRVQQGRWSWGLGSGARLYLSSTDTQ